jgi:hypothetical protein
MCFLGVLCYRIPMHNRHIWSAYSEQAQISTLTASSNWQSSQGLTKEISWRIDKAWSKPRETNSVLSKMCTTLSMTKAYVSANTIVSVLEEENSYPGRPASVLTLSSTLSLSQVKMKSRDSKSSALHLQDRLTSKNIIVLYMPWHGIHCMWSKCMYLTNIGKLFYRVLSSWVFI